MRTLLAPALAALSLLSQARPPSRARKAPAPERADAGVGIAIHVDRDGGPADAGAPVTAEDLAELRREVTALGSRTQALERDSQRGRDQEQLLRQLADQVHALRQELAQDKAQKQAREDEQVARRDQTQQAVSGLSAVQSSMAGGNTDVDRALVDLRASLPPAAQRDVDAAREALRNSDLAAARALVAQAMMDAQTAR